MSPNHAADRSVEADPSRAADAPFDERALYILAAEHSSLASARGLAYNEAFTRIGMFLSFLSISFVALALFAQATSFEEPFLGIAAVVLTFDFIVGLITLGRILGTTSDDLLAVQAMARVRRGYLQIAPYLEPYLSAGTSDDLPGVMRSYRAPDHGFGGVLYALTTSTGMTAVIVSLVGGTLAGVLAMILGIDGGAAFALGAVAAVVVFLSTGAAAARYFVRDQTNLEVRFPSPSAAAASSSSTTSDTGAP